MFELPFIASNRGIVNARAGAEFMPQLAEETKDVKLLCYWSHDAGLIHTNKAIATMDDLKGLKLRNRRLARRSAEGARRDVRRHAGAAGAESLASASSTAP